LADIVDRPFQPPRRRLDRYLGGGAQVETAAHADIVRDQVHLSERRYPAAAGGTSVSQAAAMPEARNPRGESPGPPKIGSAIVGKGFVRVTAGRQRVAQHAHPQATFKPRGRATRPMWQSVSACRLGG